MENLKKYISEIYAKFIATDKKKKAYIIAITLVVSVMAWAFISAGVITGNFNRSQLKNSENEQKVDALGIIITETKEGQKYFEIYGETGHYSNDHSIATLNNVIGNFYKDNEVTMSFQSSKGTYNEITGVITLYENTYIVLKDGVSLKADNLVWSGSDKETVANGNIIIKKDNEMISTADKCIIGAGYDKFKIVGKTQTKVFSNKK
jgi:LPS export ABC transporter protein LptC